MLSVFVVYVNNNPLSYTDPTGHSRLSKAFRKVSHAIAKASTKAVSELSQVKYVGGLLSTGLMAGTQFGYAYGATTGDWKSVGRAHATGAVLAGGAWAAPGIAAMPWYSSLGASMALGYTSGYTIAQINGASNAQASAVGQTSARYAGVMNLLYMGAMEMREQMVAQSKLNPIDNATGISAGHGGDAFKLGGCRAPCSEPDLFGGIQGKKGYFLGSEYAPGSFRDLLVETYAGPHDFLNSFMYDAKGNLSAFYQNGAGKFLGNAASYLNVAPATVFAGGSVVQPLLPYVPSGMIGDEY